MNKKEALRLLNSIMRRIKKSLNEGKFSDWKVENVPTFDDAKWKENCASILKVMSDLYKTHEINEFIFALNINNAPSVLFRLGNDNGILSKLNDVNTPENISNMVHERYKDDYAVLFPEAFMYIKIKQKSNLEKYINKNIDPTSKRLEGCEYITYNKQQNDDLYIVISVKNIMDHIEEIIDFLS